MGGAIIFLAVGASIYAGYSDYLPFELSGIAQKAFGIWVMIFGALLWAISLVVKVKK